MHEVQTESLGLESQPEATKPMPTKPKQLEPEVEIQEDDNTIHSRGKEPILANYVRRHHAPDHIVGDKSEGTMTRSKLKGTSLLVEFKPRSVKMQWKMKFGLRL